MCPLPGRAAWASGRAGATLTSGKGATGGRERGGGLILRMGGAPRKAGEGRLRPGRPVRAGGRRYGRAGGGAGIFQ
jgi:hypothetical protein